jgi:hypothetical protein
MSCCCHSSFSCVNCSLRQKILNDIKRERLQLLREQDQSLTRERCVRYSQIKEQQRHKRKEEKRRREYHKKENEIREKREEYFSVMVATGEGHRSADSFVYEKKEEEKRVKQEKKQLIDNQKKRERDAIEIRHKEIETFHLPLKQAQYRLDLRQEQANLAREDAALFYENNLAKQKLQDNLTQMVSKEKENQKIEYFQNDRITQSAEAVQQRGPIPIHAKIIRHGKTPNHDTSLVTNAVDEETERVYKTMKKRVTSELISQTATAKRSIKAHKVQQEQKQLHDINTEFHLLERIDRSGSRTHRLNNFEKVIQFQTQEEVAMLEHYQTGKKYTQPTHYSNENYSHAHVSDEKEKYFMKSFEKEFELNQPDQVNKHSIPESKQIKRDQNQILEDLSLDGRVIWKNPSDYGPIRNHLVTRKASELLNQKDQVEPTWDLKPIHYGRHVDIPVTDLEDEALRSRVKKAPSRIKQKSQQKLESPIYPQREESQDYISKLYQEALSNARDVFQSTFLNQRTESPVEGSQLDSTEIDEVQDRDFYQSHHYAPAEEISESEANTSLTESYTEDYRDQNSKFTNTATDFSTKYYLLSYQEPDNTRRPKAQTVEREHFIPQPHRIDNISHSDHDIELFEFPISQSSAEDHRQFSEPEIQEKVENNLSSDDILSTQQSDDNVPHDTSDDSLRSIKFFPIPYSFRVDPSRYQQYLPSSKLDFISNRENLDALDIIREDSPSSSHSPPLPPSPSPEILQNLEIHLDNQIESPTEEGVELNYQSPVPSENFLENGQSPVPLSLDLPETPLQLPRLFISTTPPSTEVITLNLIFYLAIEFPS